MRVESDHFPIVGEFKGMLVADNSEIENHPVNGKYLCTVVVNESDKCNKCSACA